MVKKEENKIDFIKWFSELNKNSGNVAGGKGANLGEIYNAGLPVPPGFVVTAQAYSYFIEHAGIKDKMKEALDGLDYENTKQLDEAASYVRSLILNSKMPAKMEEEIIDAYDSLDIEDFDTSKLAYNLIKSNKNFPFVAVRSSATTEDLAEASFAGQQESFLNVKGNQELINHIKKCMASLFTARATYYRHKQGFKHEESKLAVVVQKMIDSEKSGVMFSKDPSGKNQNVIIEAVFGLGEGIVSGQISPDHYEVSNELVILDKLIGNKKIAITRDSSGENHIVKLTNDKSNLQVLNESEIKRLADFGLRLERHYEKPQDIEFAIENKEIYIVQTRPITTIGKKISSEEIINAEVILSGIGASPGIGIGTVRIVKSLKDLQKISKGDILVTEMTNPDMVVAMQKCSAIVTDEGGMTAHAAIVSREMGIPAVVGTDKATSKLNEGEIITVDGFNGKIYLGKVSEEKKKEILPVVQTRTKIKVINDLPSFAERAAQTKIRAVGLTRIEGIIAESGKHPNYFLEKNEIQKYEDVVYKGIKSIAEYFDSLWIRTSDIRSDEYRNLEGSPKNIEANPMLGMHGIRFGLKNSKILKAELKALKKVSDDGKEIGILLPQLILVDELKQVKELLREIEFKDVRIGVMIETPAAVQIIKDLCEEGIDFISFGTNDLTQYILAIDRGNESVQYLYDEMHPAVLKQIEYVIRICKKYNVESSICGQSGSRKDMVKFLVERGIDSISVNADSAYEISSYVKELEETIGDTFNEDIKIEENNSKKFKNKNPYVENSF